MTEATQDLPLGLYWKNKRTEVDRIVLPFQNLEVIETINESRATREKEKSGFFKSTPTVSDGEWRNKLLWGDNKYVMNALLEKFAGKIDLIYIDPPFATGADFSTTVSIGEKEIEHTKEASAMEEVAYRDTWGKGLDSFLQMLYDRLVLMRELLSEKGTIYIHLNQEVSSYIKLLLDEIFGEANHLNDVIWHFENKPKFSFSKLLPRDWEYILVYAKSIGKHTFTHQLVPVKAVQQQAIVAWDPIKKRRVAKRDEAGDIIYETRTEKLMGSVWTIPIVHPVGFERTGYPTQKPEPLLERIIKVSSNEGDLVADFFVGSGTTASVAEKLGRRWIAADLGRFAIHTTRKRMLEIDGCKPFEILNVGKYERQFWQTLSFGKKTKEQSLAEYTAFILKLYKAESLPGSSYIHGKKGKQLVHVGSVDAPVTLSDAQMILGETKRMKLKDVIILAWEYEMGFHDTIEQEAAKAGIKLIPLTIPRDVMDRRATDAGDVQFFELAYLETDLKKTSHGFVIELKDFVIPNLDLIPQEVRKLIKKWSDYIDYWSVDWDYKDDTFHNQWQNYRIKKDRSLLLKTDAHEYPKKGIYKAMVKVIDIFGNDTTHVVEIKNT